MRARSWQSRKRLIPIITIAIAIAGTLGYLGLTVPDLLQIIIGHLPGSAPLIERLQGLSDPLTAPVGPAITVDVRIPHVSLLPGETKIFDITVTWSGSESLVIEKVEFSKHQEWFSTLQTLPVSYSLDGKGLHSAKIPVSVTVPADIPGAAEALDARVVASYGSFSTRELVPMRLIYQPTPILAWVMVVGVMAASLVCLVVAIGKKSEGT